MTEWSLNLELKTPKCLLSFCYQEKYNVVDRNNCSGQKMLRNEIRAIKQVGHEEKNYVVHTLSQPFTAEEH